MPTSDKKPVRDAREWPKTPAWISKALESAIELTKNDSDRGCVIAFGTLFDELVEVLLCTHLVRMSGQEELVRSLLDGKGKGPLGPFSVRVRVAVAMGLLPPELLKPLLAFGNVRNLFGHKYATRELTQHHIDKLLGATQPPKKSALLKLFHLFKGMRGDLPSQWSDERMRFTSMALFMVNDLGREINRDKRRLRLIAKALDHTFFMCLPRKHGRRSVPLPSLRQIIGSRR